MFEEKKQRLKADIANDRIMAECYAARAKNRKWWHILEISEKDLLRLATMHREHAIQRYQILEWLESYERLSE